MIPQVVKDSILSRNISQVESAVVELGRAEEVEEAVFLAQQAGSIRVLVTILRATNHQGSRDWEQLFIDYVAELSQDSTAAGWFDGIETFLWRSLNKEPEMDNSPLASFADIEESQVKDLRFLSNRTEGWPVWGETESSPKVISLAEWKSLRAQ